MGTGIVVTYLLIAAVVAPLLWLFWWGVTSIGSARQPSPVPVPSRAVPGARLKYSFPQPVDMRLPLHRGAIAVCRLSDGAQTGDCNGPDHSGRCSRAGADGTVPCAGCILSLPRPIRGSTEWHIPTGYQTCLVGSYEVFRQPASLG